MPVPGDTDYIGIVDAAYGYEASTGHIARIGDDVGDTNTGDYIVFGLKFTPGD